MSETCTDSDRSVQVSLIFREEHRNPGGDKITPGASGERLSKQRICYILCHILREKM
ncbi:MAG: hypothetical protein K5744_09695 [Eubacterium sp.]|nr:hypothetical protein [Eubacterium sp.]